MRKTAIALAAALAMLLAGCSGSPKGEDGDASDSSSTGADEPADEPEPLMLGTQRYVSPCRLLPPADAVRIYRDTGSYASFSQRIVEKSKTAAQMREIGQTVGASVQTDCNYFFTDRLETLLTLDVKQYPSPAAAKAAWKRIKVLGTGAESRQLEREGNTFSFLYEWAKENEANSGGDPVRGLDPTILFVAGRTEFTGVRGNLLITFARKNFAGQAFEGKEIRDALTTTRRVFSTVYAHADDPDLDQSPVPSYWQQAEGWPTFLDACQVFDDEIMVTLTGHASYEAQDDSVLRDPDHRIARNDSPGSRAVHNECGRTGKVETDSVRRPYWHGTAEFVYGAPGDSGAEVLQGYVLRRVFDDEKSRKKYTLADLIKAGAMKKVEVDGTDSAYVFDHTTPAIHVRFLVANVGDHVFRLDGDKMKGLKTTRMPVPRLLKAGAQLAANIAAATTDETENESSG